MKQILKLLAICLSLFVLAGCITAPLPKPFIDQAIWPETTKDKIYNACLTALTLEGFDIHPLGTSKENGLIVTGQRKFIFQTDKARFSEIICYYNLQCLVAEAQDNKVTVIVNVVNPGWKYTEKIVFWGIGDDDIKSYINNRAAEALEKFFAQLDILLGKAEYYRCDKVLEWEE
jgi:hypothetical protein